MNKKTLFIPALLSSLVLTTACSEDAEEFGKGVAGNVPVTLTSNILSAVTKGGTSLNETKLTTGDVTVRTSTNYATAYTYSAQSDGSLTSEGYAYYPAGGSTIDIVAYSPAIAGSATSSTFTVAADQSADADYIASDLLWAQATGKSSASGTVAMAFGHKMAKLIINATAGAGVSTIQSITLKNVKRQCTFTYGTGAISDVATTGSTDVIVANSGSSSTLGGAAVVPAQSWTDADFLEIVTDQGTATYTLSGTKAVAEGNYYTVNLIINKVAVGATNTIAAWSDSGTANIQPTSGGAASWTVTVSGTYTYNGSAITPSASNITVKDASENTIDASNYAVYCENNTNAGNANIIIYGKGSEAGNFAYSTYPIAKAAGSISYATTSVTKSIGDTYTNTLTHTGDGTVTYASSDEAVATVTSAGQISALKAGTTTITATVADGTNYTYATKTKTYTLTVVAETTLSDLKKMINQGSDVSAYLGLQVDASGNVKSSVSGTLIGYVGYVSTSDVDTGVSGSRILVLASADASTGAAWGTQGTSRGLTTDGMTGYSYTNTLQGYGSSAHPAAYAAWSYSGTIPSGGATPAHWFMPTKAQLSAIVSALGGYSTFKTKVGWASANYWSSTEKSADNACYLGSSGSWYGLNKGYTGYVRSVFAY